MSGNEYKIMPEPIIKVENLVKRYKHATVNAVNDISFNVTPGTFFALLGPNGAGKTTTISILTTTLLPTAGRVTIAGHDVIREPSAVRDNIGIIFQKPSLDLNLTAEENIRFHATLYGLHPYRPFFSLMPSSYRQQVHTLAKLLGIEKNLFQSVKRFSGGMMRKLEILRSLMHRPRVLFLDEPTMGLDPASRRSLWEHLKQVREESETTIFLTTHYLEEAEGADVICIINHGNIVSYGTPTEVKSELIEEYLLLNTDDRERLRNELTQLHLPFSEEALFKVKVEAHKIHQTLKAIETPLTTIETHTPSLEDAYLEITGEA
jgi:ABC-2 type transport system ATP-binding protein